MHIELSKSCIRNGNIWQQSLQFHEKIRAVGFEMELWEDHTGTRVWLATLQNTFSATFLGASEKDEELFHQLFCGAESCILPRRNTHLASIWHIFTPWKPWNETMLKFDNKSSFNDPWLSLLPCKCIKTFNRRLSLFHNFASWWGMITYGWKCDNHLALSKHVLLPFINQIGFKELGRFLNQYVRDCWEGICFSRFSRLIFFLKNLFMSWNGNNLNWSEYEQRLEIGLRAMQTHNWKIECKKYCCEFLLCMYIIYITCIYYLLVWSMALVSVEFKVWKEKQLVASFTTLTAVNHYWHQYWVHSWCFADSCKIF